MKPIVVPQSAVDTQLWTATRYAMTALGAALMTRGVMNDEHLATLAGLAFSVGPALWAVVLDKLKHRKMVALKAQAQVAELDLSQCP